jgi:hypothetical protein
LVLSREEEEWRRPERKKVRVWLGLDFWTGRRGKVGSRWCFFGAELVRRGNRAVRAPHVLGGGGIGSSASVQVRVWASFPLLLFTKPLSSLFEDKIRMWNKRQRLVK